MNCVWCPLDMSTLDSQPLWPFIWPFGLNFAEPSSMPPQPISPATKKCCCCSIGPLSRLTKGRLKYLQLHYTTTSPKPWDFTVAPIAPCQWCVLLQKAVQVTSPLSRISTPTVTIAIFQSPFSHALFFRCLVARAIDNSALGRQSMNHSGILPPSIT